MKQNRTYILSLAFAALSGMQATGIVAAEAESAATTHSNAEGKLVVCFASKGDYRNSPGSEAGLKGLASLLHKYGYRGTYYLKPSTIEACKAELQDWNKAHGDEVGWLADGESLARVGDDLKIIRDLLPGQKVRSAGQLRYGAPWVHAFEENGVDSVWGRCYEQSATDGITDRGCPFGFYYAKPDCFKVPNQDKGGVISVPWLSNDLNLVFRTAQQSTFTFDPNDSQDIGVSTPADDSFWRAELNEYKKQAKYNKVVPLVIQQEIGEFDFSKNADWRNKGAAIFENFLKILKEEGIEVVTVSEAVDMYKAANPSTTPPTYGIFGNIAATTPIIKNSKSLQPVTERFAIARKEQYKCYGPTFNGFYATGRLGRTWYYYEPNGVPLDAFGKNISYYDKNGLLVFIEGNSSPVRITPYSNLPKDAFSTAILPEMSHWFDTEKFIPKAEVKTSKTRTGLTVSVKATTIANTIYIGEQMPYGVVLWGDYSAYVVPANAPIGTKILCKDGLFIPMLLKDGENALSVDFTLAAGFARAAELPGVGINTPPQLKLAAMFCDHIVLQRAKPIRVWGWAPAGETIIVEFSGQAKQAKVDSQGKWQVQLAPLPASSEGKTLVVRSGGVEKKIADVVVGEVWFCSGQSNMELSLGRYTAEEQKEAENQQLRFFTFGRQADTKPLDDVKNGRWLVVGPQTVGHVYATAYYFAKMVQKELGIPVGFIQGAIGGTPIEAWMARETLASDPEMDQIAETGIKLTREGEIKNKEHLAQGGDPNKLPWPMWRIHQTPSRLYNGMIHPFTPLTIRGFIWYQGEHNLGNPKAYAKLFPAHITGWRSAWGLGDIPFYYCQLPGIVVKGGPTPEGNVALMRLIQAQAQALPKTGMAVIYDTAEEDNNHPENKRPAGERLARLALSKDYGKEIVCSGPVYSSSKKDGTRIRVSFSSLGSGLVAKEIPMEYRPSTRKPEIKPVTRTNPGSQLEGFQIQNEKGEWIWADARIDGNDVVVALKEDTTVKAIRYACIDFGFFNLFNKEGLPAAPFEAPVKYGYIASSWAASPEVQPAEPERLRSMPRPADLPLEPGPFKGDWDSIAAQFVCPEWFFDAKFGIWAHWSADSAGEAGDWYHQRLYCEGSANYKSHVEKFGHPSKVGYKDVVQTWKAEKFDPDALMAFFKDNGARFFFTIGVHMNNFDNWNSKYHRWNAVNMGPHKDIVGLWQAAAKKEGIPFGITEHLASSYRTTQTNKGADKSGPYAGIPYDGNDPANVDLYHPKYRDGKWQFTCDDVPEWWKHAWYRRMHDLVTTYQPDMMDTDDFGLPFPEYSIPLVAHYYNLKAKDKSRPRDGLWTCRKHSSGKGTVLMTEFGFPSVIRRYAWIRAECLSQWAYNKSDDRDRSGDCQIATLVEIVSKGGNFLLSPAIKPDGTIVPLHAKAVEGLGIWLRLNGEAIYGTRPWRIFGEGPTDLSRKEVCETLWKPGFRMKDDDIRFTSKGETLYAICMGGPQQSVLVKSLGTASRLVDGKPSEIRLLGYEGKVEWKQGSEGLNITIPAAWSGRTMMAFAIKGFAPWDGDLRPDPNDVLVLGANEAKQHGIHLNDWDTWISDWTDSKEWLSWDKARFFAPGEYEVTINGGGMRADVPYKLQIGEKELTGKAPSAGGWGKGVVFPAGKITIENAGVFPVALRAGSDTNWGGLQLFNVTLKRMK